MRYTNQRTKCTVIKLRKIEGNEVKIKKGSVRGGKEERGVENCKTFFVFVVFNVANNDQRCA